MEEKNMEFLFDAAGRVLEASRQNELSINKQINKAEEINNDLKRTIEKLNQTKNEINNILREDVIQNEINFEIKKTLDDNSKIVAKEITKKVLTNFQEANYLAIEASEIYKKAIKWSIWKLFFFALIFFILSISVIVVYYRFYLPREINALNQKKEILTQDIQLMQNNIDQLKKLGGDINFVNCDDNNIIVKCVEVIPEKVFFSNDGKKEFHILKLK